MNGRSGLQWRLVMALAALSLLGAGCGLMAPRADKYPQPRAGTTWTNMNRDTGSYGSGSSQISGRFVANRTWQGSEVHAFEFGGITTLMTQGNANFIVQLTPYGVIPVVGVAAGTLAPEEMGRLAV